MRNVRFHPDASNPAWPPSAGAAAGRSRFNMLLTEDRWREPDHWSRQLPRLMEPMGVVSYIARCGEEALEVASSVPIHAAVVDISTPKVARTMPQPSSEGSAEDYEEQNESAPPTGLWILELFRRLPSNPPVVIVRSRTITTQDVNRLLRDALRLGAFTVMENPVPLEQLLGVFRRLLDRLYQGHWPQE
jgi:CheY-like chemotaxis protein